MYFFSVVFVFTAYICCHGDGYFLVPVEARGASQSFSTLRPSIAAPSWEHYWLGSHSWYFTLRLGAGPRAARTGTGSKVHRDARNANPSTNVRQRSAVTESDLKHHERVRDKQEMRQTVFEPPRIQFGHVT